MKLGTIMRTHWSKSDTTGEITQRKKDLPYSYESTYVWYILPKVLTQVYYHDRKIWKAFLNM